MRLRWPPSFRSRILAVAFVSSLVPAVLLLGGSLYLNARVQQQMQREVDEALTLAINLEQALIDASLTRMRERAVAVAAHPEGGGGGGGGGGPRRPAGGAARGGGAPTTRAPCWTRSSSRFPAPT
ncbi:MAG: hypothetical protein AB2385_00700 [Symbiobacterium sp.]|uniref:hypothetical protein n=1 Tax=Symbiobacterium sp. TaxID=1971213 RepID=UPI003463B99F